MKQIDNWQKSVVVPSLLFPDLTTFATLSTAVSTAMLYSISPSTLERTSFQNGGGSDPSVFLF